MVVRVCKQADFLCYVVRHDICVHIAHRPAVQGDARECDGPGSWRGFPLVSQGIGAVT